MLGQGLSFDVRPSFFYMPDHCHFLLFSKDENRNCLSAFVFPQAMLYSKR